MRKNSGFYWLAALALVGAAACADDGNPTVGNVTARSFTVTVQNVSTDNTIAAPRLNGTVPLSPGVYAVFTGADPLFTVGGTSDQGTERIAEDGVNSFELTALANAGTLDHGTFDAPGGANASPILGPGESATFTFIASPGARLQIETMFTQSDDWFYSFGNGGLALFNGQVAIDGDVTAQLVLYDAGTEADLAPGTGPDQATAQAAGATNIGPADTNTLIRTAGGFPIPATGSVIKVTISSTVATTP